MIFTKLSEKPLSAFQDRPVQGPNSEGMKLARDIDGVRRRQETLNRSLPLSETFAEDSFFDFKCPYCGE